MKKAKRILSFLMAFVMLSSILSVAASAKAAYKDAAITTYDDLDKPVFTFDQQCSMLLDYVDVMLAEANQKIDLSVLGTLDLTSVDNALNGITDLIGGALFTLFGGLLGDLKNLNIDAIESPRRASTPAGTADKNVVLALVQFLSDNRTIISKVVDGHLNMGLANSFVDLSEININKMLKEMVYGLVNPDVEEEDYPATLPALDTMIQDLINNLIVGEIDPETGEPDGLFPELDGYIDIVNSTAPAYDFGEELLRNLYNIVVVPLLNTDVKKLIREVCGVVYEDSVTYPDGDESNLNEYADILDIHYTVPTHNFAAGATLVTDLNNILYEVVNAMTVDYNAWVPGANTLVIDNLAAALKYVLTLTGNAFFEDYIPVASSSEIAAMNNQQLFSYVLRSVLNSSIEYADIPADADTLIEVAWYGVKEAMAQNVPAIDYSAQPKTLDGVLYMVADLAVFFLNGLMDMNPGATGTTPGTGLLPYGQGFDATLTAIMNWVRVNYGGLVNLTLSQTDGWAALDTLVFSVIQANWLPASINGSTKELLKNRILQDVLDLDIASILDLFTHRGDSEFATKTIKKVLIDTVARVFNLIFPGAFKSTYTTFEQMLSNAELKTIVENLLNQLNVRKNAILPALLPIVTPAMGISGPEEYGNPDIQLPKQLNATTTFAIRNDSKGLNTGATNKAGTFTQDALYKVKIVSVASSIPAITVTNLAGTVINGGDAVNCTVGGTFGAGQVLVVTITYDVFTELGAKLTNVPLTARAFSYIASPTADDGDNYINMDPNTNNKHTLKYKNEYVHVNGSMASITGNQIVVSRDKTTWPSHIQDSTISRTSASVNAALAGVTPAAFTNATSNNDGGSWNFNVYAVAAGAAMPAPAAYSSTYVYKATKTSSSGGDETYTVPHYVVVYDDFGLGGLLNSELSNNRDPANYSDSGLWDDYIFALKNAVAVQYRPRAATTFMSFQGAAFENAKLGLDAAIEALETCEIATGVDQIKAALDTFAPPNEDLEFDDPAFVYMSDEDYVPYTYDRYDNERDHANGLWASQQLPEEPVLPEDPTPDEILAYNEAHAKWVIAYAEAQANMVRLKAVDVAYALHRLNLYGGRLVRVQATKARLSEDLARIQAKGFVEGQYTTLSWAEYERALAFAVAVNAESATATDGTGEWILKPSKVEEARNRLIEAAKKLIKGADYTQLLAYITEAQALNADDWTPESFAAIAPALTNALAVPLEMALNPANQAIIDNAAAALRAAIDALIEAVEDILLVPTAGFEPVITPPAGPGEFGQLNGLIPGMNPLDFVTATGDGSVAIVPTAGGNGTGAVVNLLDGDDNVIASFTVIFYGDVNGDATIQATDADLCVLVQDWMIDWSAEPWNNTAADLNGDTRVDSIDADLINAETNWVVTIDQNTGLAS